MSETNKTYRIKTDVGTENSVININTSLLQDYDALDILSVKISSVDMYKLHNSNYGVVVGRVLANNGFGVPNAKLSIFIELDSNEGEKVRHLYPFTSTSSRNEDGVRYNLLPDNKVNDCHQVVGTFPNKRYMLDNDVVLEVFDKYYKYTTRTNNGGDYLIMGVPVGSYILHMDLDLSDCGILSQKPRDFVHKGYTIEQFESPTIFKKDTELSNLSQVFTQEQTITVHPFWGNEESGEQIGITRADINVAFKFETTCVFLGSVVSDSPSNGITRKCMATENMGNMEELTTGEGTIEMIRKTPSGEIEEFQVRGTQLIDSNGVWCYQIPMNLDYMMTDEYGNMIPTDDPEKGIPTRASVRFRISMQDNEENTDNFYRAKILVPHNPQIKEKDKHEDYDYEFGTLTRDESFRDLFYDNVYSVKSYIPRFQKKKTRGWKDKKFTGIKSCNFHGNNNPIPYNNMRIRLPFMFTVMCAIIKCFIFLTGIFNTFISSIGNFLSKLGNFKILGKRVFPKAWDTAIELRLNVLSEGLCPDLENWYFAPMRKVNLKKRKGYDLMKQTLDHLLDENGYNDEKSIEYNNSENEDEVFCITTKMDYLIACVEMNLAMEYKVINFDFYNDWINGLIYIPRFMYYIRRKKTFLGITFHRAKVRSCMDNPRIFGKTRRYTQQCAIPYKKTNIGNYVTYTQADNILDRNKSKRNIRKSNNFHKKNGFAQVSIFGKNGGITHEHTTSKKQNVYYMKPCEWKDNRRILFYATDIILLGSLRACNQDGIPQAFKYLSSTSYLMPTNLALTNMETNGALYMNDKNTICAGSSTQTNFGNENKSDAIRLFNPSSGLSAELDVYAGSGDRNIDTTYDGNELSDLIPLTEASGIAWNFTGPDQGSINEKQMYYPGGHFLGMTCTNSQTNIKSCVNLSRICELGVNMSQRREDVLKVEFGENGEDKATYVNSIPTGLISGTEIVAEDFRGMFATLNQNRLCATKLNTETGYYTYDFDFVKPINFEGSLSKIAETSEYNKQINVIDVKEEEKLLRRYGIATSENRPDNEGGESTITTQALTIEDTSIDYYRFRLGLDNSNLKTNDKIQKQHFLITTSSKYYLPQYENSFYFYFGMKQGATAIDEFNRQFFSVCDTSKIVTGIPTIDLSVNDIEICNGTGSIKVIFDNFELPLRSFYYEKEVDGNIVTTYLMSEKDNYRTQYSSIISGLTFGRYTFFATDSNGVEISKTIDLGIDIFIYDMNIYDFNVFDSSEWLNSNGKRNSSDKNIFIGGYANFSDVNVIPDYQEDFKGKKITFTVKNKENNFSEDTGIYVGSDSDGNVFVPKANDNIEGFDIPVVYSVYLNYSGVECLSSESTASSVSIYLTTFTVKDGKNVKLKMGSAEHNLYFTIGSHKGDDDAEFTYPIVLKETNYDENGERLDTYTLSAVTETGNTLYFGSGGGINYNSNPSLNFNNIRDWIKGVSTIKTNDMLFSNNVYTDNDLKVLWGRPQNSNNEIHKDIFVTEGEIPEGYSLDDDGSYRNTDESVYSSVAVDGDCVSGDFYGILMDGKFYSGKNYSCKGAIPMKNTGYVFKPLPYGDLEYYVCNGGNDYSKCPIDNNGEKVYKNGVYYSSFYYPVNESKFKFNADFFIWGERFVYLPENEDASPEIKYEELAGKCEYAIQNGIRYKNKFGANGEDINITNIPSGQIFNSISGNGMLFTGYTINDEGEEIYFENDSRVTTKIGGVDHNVASGYTGQTEIYFNFSEGFPDIEGDAGRPKDEKEYYLSSLVNHVSEQMDYENTFADYACYEYLKGEGIVAYLKNIEQKTYRVATKNENKNVLICFQPKNEYTNKIIDVEDGPGKYFYIKIGKKKPTYYILYTYKDNQELHNNRPGDICFVTVDYYRKSRFMCYYSYLIPGGNDSDSDESDDGEAGKKITVGFKCKKQYNNRGKLDNIVAEINKNDPFNKIMEPIIKRVIRSDVNWYSAITTHNKYYVESNNIEYKQPTDGYYYCVEKRENNGMTLYKIFPTFLFEEREDEGITLSNYAIEYTFTKNGNGEFVIDGNLKNYIRITYEVSRDTGTTVNEYSAKNIDEAKNKLKFYDDSDLKEGLIINFNDNDDEIINCSVNTSFINYEKFEDYNKAINDETNYSSVSFSSETLFNISYVIIIDFKNKYTKDFDHTRNIKFYLSDKNNGENLRITINKYQSYIVFINEVDGVYSVSQNKEVVFDNTGGTQSFLVGISEEQLKKDEFYYSGYTLTIDNSTISYTNITCANNYYYDNLIIDNKRYYKREITVIVEESIKTEYNCDIKLYLTVDGVDELPINYENYFKVKVNKGNDGIWFEPNIIYYFVQLGNTNENDVNNWKNKYVKNENEGVLYISDDIKSQLNNSALIISKTYTSEWDNIISPYINNNEVNNEILINGEQKISFNFVKNYDIDTYVKDASNKFSIFKREYTYDVKVSTFETNVMCKILPYACFTVLDRIDDYSFNNNVNFTIFHNDGSEGITIVNGGSGNLIFKYSDFTGNDINKNDILITCKFNEHPGPGLFYLSTDTRYRKDGFNIMLGGNYGTNLKQEYSYLESYNWNDNISYEISLSSKNFIIDKRVIKSKNLYLNKIDGGDEYSFTLSVDMYSLTALTNYSYSEISLGIYDNGNEVKLGYSRQTVTINLEKYNKEDGINIRIEYTNNYINNCKIIFRHRNGLKLLERTLYDRVLFSEIVPIFDNNVGEIGYGDIIIYFENS